MKKEILANVAILIGAILFNTLFWQEMMGINTLIFALFLVAALWFLNKDSFSERNILLATGGVLVSALLVVFNNSLFVKLIHILTMPILIGFVQARSLRFIGLAFSLYLANMLETPRHFIHMLKTLPILRGRQTLIKTSINN